jgi:hypothetical protein
MYVGLEGLRMVATEAHHRRLPLLPCHTCQTKPTKQAAAPMGWHGDAPEDPKMMKNGSNDIEDDSGLLID